MSEFIKISDKRIGPSEPPYLVAEISGNHNGKLENALKIIEAANDAGADAVKLQTYTADTMTIKSSQSHFKINEGLWKGYTLYELYDWAHTPWEWHQALFDKGRDLGITVFSTPFDRTSVEFLEKMDAPAYKIASFEATDLELIKDVAQTGKPVIISTGMANFEEVAEAVETARMAACDELVLLHCVSAYPSPYEDMNLLTIRDLSLQFGVVSGFSDHTIGNAVSVASVALGASFIEKHLTLNRDDGGPDAAFSAEPHEFKMLVESCKSVKAALGNINYDRKKSEKDNVIFRRSLFVVKDVHAGERFDENSVRNIRPGNGLPPKYLKQILGRRATQDIKCGTPLDWPLVES